MDSGTSNFSFPLYSTVGKTSTNLHFITCHGMNFGYGTACGAPFGSSIYGVDYLPWYDLTLTPVP
jgi:hypothetical protein